MQTVTEGAPPARFSDVLRAGTSDEHRRAEGSTFARDLLRGQIPRDGYVALAAQLWFVYTVLEEAGDVMRADPVAEPFVFDELRRVPALERDLTFLVGADWEQHIEPLPATAAYCTRLREVAFTWPGGFVAHHYTRYLGDLSGGQAIRKVVVRTFELTDGDGVQFYDFPDIADPKAFKATYRGLLDGAPWDDDERARIVEESSIAFRHNGALLAQLSTVGS
jgi:heme oxygenase